MAFCGAPSADDNNNNNNNNNSKHHLSDNSLNGSRTRGFPSQQQTPAFQQQYHFREMNEAGRMDREHSAFGDGYSLKSRNSYSTMTSRYHDEPEADYDHGATDLYRRIENKDWDGALSRLEMAPLEAKTWVLRREYDGSNKTRWRLLPLHAVCIFRAPLALIEALIEVYPDGPQMKDDQGMLPVHLACRNGASKGVVLTLLMAFPDSIHVRDRKTRSPMDLVETSNSANKEAVLSAIKRFSKEYSAHNHQHGNFSSNQSAYTTATPQQPHTPAPVVQEVDYENRTTLFRMILKKDWKAATSRAASYTDEAATWIVTKGFNGNLRFLPLHKACVLQPPEAVVAALLSSYPEGSKAKDQDGWLPIHCACFYGASDKIINALLVAHPKGAQTKDDEGRLPLHYACLKGASKAVVDVLLASFGKGAMVKDDEGRLPIHHACSKGAPENIIEVLLKTSPKGAQSKDDQGRLALHHACRKNATERVIRTLLRVYPRAAQIKDDQDKLPIHYACQHGASGATVNLLLQTYPESVSIQNGFGFTPVAEVKALNNPKMDGVVRILEKAKKEQDRNRVRSDENAAMDSKVTVLQDRIAQLEKTLGKVTILGKEMKNDLKRKKDPTAIMDKFSHALIELGSRSSGGGGNRRQSASQPLKSRQTPSNKGKGIFGRARGGKNKA